ncbi:hypothetical protein GLOIN_2v1775615 [Rhizophagus irregularis DAOM 181602=DAOM 197198]|nr:hypothetical protein GLOIN_2v1775615 [Rhizophagus irregularis DAOM 181602=DAOM 197198]
MALENRVSKVEESVDKNNDNNQGDEEYIKKIIKEVAKKLLEASIYPTPDELREFTNNYMNENYDDFIKRFKRYNKWIIFYEKNIASPLQAKHQFNLPTIPAVNTALKESEIRKWKGSPAVKNCYSKNQLSNMQIAYAISICEIILNPKNLHIQVTESVIKPVLTKNLKKITSKDNYSYSDNDEIEAFQEAEETNKGVDEAAEVDEAEEVADEAEEVLQEEEENEIREEDEEEGGRIYISSTDEETKERMRRLKKQYKK